MKKTLNRKLTREKAKSFLESLAGNYRTFSGFEDFARQYKGEHKSYLTRVVGYLRKANQGSNRIYGLGDSEIEQILDATFL
ncbi:MAG: hypothetical protein PHH54_04055 [Candidatus Nanoarchaeia archaeon]|nr:hypothetical protein [Candidatus Nanoarchaeia archaeon]MDD5741133.1 hypothetical protein [Candidatus Nanoarchaeia archaeon]